jgi:predicted CoA-binding protein
MRYLLEHGYRVIPVRPLVEEVLGVRCVGSLAEIDEPIDLVTSSVAPRPAWRSPRRPRP